MTESNPSSPPIPSSIWNELNGIASCFDKAWTSGAEPSIDAYLKEAAADVDHAALTAELVHMDLEHRLRRGEAVRVEDYFQRYPELAADREEAVELITSEYRFRCPGEPELTADEFLERFPQYRDDLAQRLAGPHRPRSGTASRLNCPHCRQLVTVEGDTWEREISCSACGHSFRVEHTIPAAEPPVELTQLDQFQLLGVAGEGGFGTVYRARDTQLDRIVAVKVPRGMRGGSWETDRFLREARNAAQLAHPGIVPTYEVGRAGTLPYIVSAFIQGRTLAEELNHRRLGFREAADVAAQVARALAYAHAQGVIHRDLKPSNIMLGRVEGSVRPNGRNPNETASTDEARAFVMDFGLARRDDGEVRVTMDGQILGTPLYMSPEQARGEGRDADARSDVYTLGVILYELLTGEAPFRGTARMIFQKILEEDPQPPRRLNDKIPRDLETITLKCLAKEPGRRYQTAAELAGDLERFLADRPILARPVGRAERLWRWARRNPRTAVLSGLVLILLLSWAVGGPVALIAIDRQRRAAVAARAVAEQREKLNLDALSKIVVEMQQELDDHPERNELKQKLLNIALDLSEKMAAIAPNAAGDRAAARAYTMLGNIYLTLGQTAEARQKFLQAFELLQALAAAAPGEVVAQRNLYLIYGRLGEVNRRTGKILEARRYYQQALELAQTRVNAAPGAIEARYELIGFHNELADTYAGPGDHVKARTHLQKAVEIAEALEAANPNFTKAKVRLAETYLRVGDEDHHSGRFEDALREYERSRNLYESLARVEPNGFQVRYSLAASYSRLGSVHQAQSQRAEALKWYQKSQDLFQYLARKASHRGIQSNLAVGYDRLSTIKNLLGDVPAALEYARKALAEREDLAAADPENADLQYAWAVACYNVGELAMQTHEFAQAARSYEQVLAILQRLIRAGKLVNVADVQGLLRVAKRLLVIARLAPAAAENLASALWAPDEGLLAFSAGLVGSLTAPQGQGPWLVTTTLFPGRAGPDDRIRELLCIRAAVLARRGYLAEAAATAETLRAIAPYDRNARYNVACSYAACVAAVTQGKPSDQLTPGEVARKQHYADLAVTALKEAVDLGFTNVQHIVTDRDLVPIFKEEGFTNLIKEIKAKGRGAETGK